jgi:hypothetical protein
LEGDKDTDFATFSALEKTKMMISGRFQNKAPFGIRKIRFQGA